MQNMKYVYKIVAIIYKVYINKNVGIPHSRTIATLFGISLLLYADILLVFDLPSYYFMPWSHEEDTKSTLWLKMCLIFTPIILLLAIVFNKNKLDKIPVRQKEIDKANKAIPIVFIFLILLMLLFLIKLGLEKGTI
jgi:hypothetical protein